MQTPHSVHRTASMTAISSMVIAALGHSPTQAPHPLHLFASTEMVMI